MQFTIRTKDKNGNYKEITAKKVVPDGRMNPGTGHKYRTVKAEYQARYLSGRNGLMRRGSDQKFATAMNSFSKYCETKGVHSMDNLDSRLVMDYVRALQNDGSFTRATKTTLTDSYIADLVGGLRTMLLTTKQDWMLRGTYSDMGLNTSREAKEKPMTFVKGYTGLRDAYQRILEGLRTKWYAEAANVGRWFGLREAERIESRDLITKIKGQFYATHRLSPMKPITEKQLKERYGKTIMQRTKEIKEGKTYLIVEHAKGTRNRFCEVTPGMRQDAINRLHSYIRSQPGHVNNMRVYPDKTTTQQAERNYTRTQERNGGHKDSQMNSHADRHFEIQRMYAE